MSKYHTLGPEFPIVGESSLPELYRSYRALNKPQDSIFEEAAAFSEWLETFFFLFEDPATVVEVVRDEN